MGSGDSREEEPEWITPPANPNFPYFSLTFCDPNIVSLCMAPAYVCTMIQEVSLSVFASCLDDFYVKRDGTYELVYRGKPFANDACREEEVFAGQLSTRILQCLYADGWTVLSSSNTARYTKNSTWFMQRICSRRPQPEIICLAQIGNRRLQLVDCPKQVMETIVSVINRCDYFPNAHPEPSESSKLHWIEFSFSLWNQKLMQVNVTARQVMLEVFNVLKLLGYHLCTVACLKSCIDTMYFIREDNASVVNGPAMQQFCMISLFNENILRLIDCPQRFVQTVGNALHRVYKNGVKREGLLEVDGPSNLPAYGFELRDDPWNTSGWDAAEVRLLFIEILESLVARGWCLAATVNMSYSNDQKSSFIFRTCIPQTVMHMCMALMDTGELLLSRVDPIVVHQVRDVILSCWSPGIAEDESDGVLCHRFVLPGSPWVNNANQGRVLLLRLLSMFAANGWRVISCADVSTRMYVKSASKGNRAVAFKYDPSSWFLARVGTGT